MIATLHTRQTRVLYIFSIIAIGALLLVLFLHFSESPVSDVVTQTQHDSVVSIGTTDIPVSVADTQAEQEQGLSGTTSLDQNTGKLFVFKTPGEYGFWMKDMLYSIDIIWIDKDFKIIGISKDLTPESYPTVFYPPGDVLYVLEVNAGFSTTHNLSVNQLMRISNNLSF